MKLAIPRDADLDPEELCEQVTADPEARYASTLKLSRCLYSLWTELS